MAFTINQAFDLLKGAHDRGRLAHAFMLTGGSRSLQSELAAKIIGMLNAPAEAAGMDLFGDAPTAVDKPLEEWEGEYIRILRPQSKSRRIRVDDVRELEKIFYKTAATGTWKVGVILDAERMNEQACNAFLKTLEEPPKQSILLLLTSEPEMMLPTILSRCIEVPLHLPGQTVSDRFPAWVMDAVDRMAQLLKQGLGKTSIAMAVRGIFAEALLVRRSEITKSHEADQKAEISRYKNATDGAWLKEREEYYKAIIESDYMVERSRLIDAVLTFMGDIARAQTGSADREFGMHEEASTKCAEEQTIITLLPRIDAIKELKRRAEQTNVHEQLSLDVAFLDAFA